MPSSDTARRRKAIDDVDPIYAASLDSFLDHLGIKPGQSDVVKTFHSVRNFRYFSNGDRSPKSVLRDGRGACTAKHILLRDLLRRQGESADVELIEGDFAASMPVVKSMPESLKGWISTGGILDFHCYVVWRGFDREQILDATWPDTLLSFGFAVNSTWAGEGDTLLAIAPRHVKARVEDVIGRKERMLSSLSREELHNRKVFLGLLSDWLAELDHE